MSDKSGERLSISQIDELFVQGRTGEAEKALQDLYRRNPDFADVCNRLGQFYYETEDYTRAKEFFERAVRLNPDYTEASLNLAVTLNELRQYGKAKEIIEQAQTRATRKKSSLEPFIAGKLANKHKEIGDIYRELNLYIESVEEYRKALNLSPGFPDIQVKLAVTLREMGRTDEALEILTKTTQLRPDYLDARIQLGITFFSRGFLDRASDQWKEVLRINPTHTKALMYMSFLREDQAHFGEKSTDAS